MIVTLIFEPNFRLINSGESKKTPIFQIKYEHFNDYKNGLSP